MGKSKTHEEYVAQVVEVNPNVKVMGKYYDSKTKILHKCEIDGNEWLALPTNILKGHGCPKCMKRNLHNRFVKTQDKYINELPKVNPNIEVVGQYVNAKTPILHRCKIDGYKWMVSPDSILRGTGCPVCSGVKKKTHEEYVAEMKSINPDIDVLECYINALTPILHKCLIDGHEWEITPHDVLQGKGCPICNCSLGERKVKSYLNDHNIKFIPQYTFDDCRNVKVLPFDFYLPEYNILVEYDGIQHFEPVEHFGGEKHFLDVKKRDAIKTNYCNTNNIPLLRIRYDEDIDETLRNFFNNTKLWRRNNAY